MAGQSRGTGAAEEAWSLPETSPKRGRSRRMWGEEEEKEERNIRFHPVLTYSLK